MVRTMHREKQNSGRAIFWILAAVAIVIVVVGVSVFSVILPPASKRSSGSAAKAFRQRWEFAGAGPVKGALALASEGTLYAASVDGFVYALDPKGNLLWKFHAGPVEGAPVVGPDGTIYVTDSGQLIHAINHSGSEQWTFGGGPYADRNMGSVSAALDQNFLYTPWRAALRAIRLDTGTPSWPTGMGFQRSGTVSLLPGGLVAFSELGRIQASDSTGRMVWQYPAPNPPITPDSLMKSGGRPPVGSFWLESGIAVALDGTLYVCAAPSRVVAVLPYGNHKWDFATKRGSVNRATPVISADGSIYVASGDGSVYALNPDGTLKWATSPGSGDTIVATPMLAQDGTIYVINGIALYAIAPDGKVISETPVAGGAESSPTLAEDGTVYVASRNGKIIAFEGTHGPLMNGPWPKFQHDAANTARAQSF